MNVRAYKRNISVSTVDFRPLTYESTAVDWRQQLLTSFYIVCGALFACKREITVVSLVVRAVMRGTNIRSQLVEHFVTKLGMWSTIMSRNVM